MAQSRGMVGGPPKTPIIMRDEEDDIIYSSPRSRMSDMSKEQWIQSLSEEFEISLQGVHGKSIGIIGKSNVSKLKEVPL